jgi:pyrimidine operon attenuation protein/uracil phosphoribosyltransferase
VDRKHRKFPIRADFVGLTLSTTLQEHITVEFGKYDCVYLD